MGVRELHRNVAQVALNFVEIAKRVSHRMARAGVRTLTLYADPLFQSWLRGQRGNLRDRGIFAARGLLRCRASRVRLFLRAELRRRKRGYRFVRVGPIDSSRPIRKE